MRRLLGGLVLIGAAAGAGVALRNYLRGPENVVQGDVRITLDGGTELTPEPAEAREFVDIARKVIELSA